MAHLVVHQMVRQIANIMQPEPENIKLRIVKNGQALTSIKIQFSNYVIMPNSTFFPIPIIAVAEL